jgi:hypothetical protein
VHKYAGPSFLLAQGNVIVGTVGLADRAQAEALARALLPRAKEALAKYKE